MAFSKSYKRFTYRDDPDWEDGSFWQFRTDLSDVDDDVATDMVAESILGQVSVDEYNKARADGTDLNEYLRSRVSRRAVLTAKRAFLIAKTVKWGGPDFIIPEDYQDDSQEPIGEDDEGEPVYPTHADAGKLAAVTPFWVGQHDPEVIDRVYEALQKHMQGRSAPEQADFRGSRKRVDRPNRERSRPKEVQAPA